MSSFYYMEPASNARIIFAYMAEGLPKGLLEPICFESRKGALVIKSTNN